MAYSGPVYQAREQDRRGDIAMQAGANFGATVGAGIASMGERLQQIADNKSQAEALDSGLAAMRATRPDMVPVIDELADDFYGSNLKGKQTIFSQLMAYGQRTDAQQQQGFDNSLKRRQVEVQEGRLLNDTTPKLPTTMPDPRDASAPPLMVNPESGNLMDLPPLPNNDGAQVLPFGDSGYGVGVYNGRPVTGAIPMRSGETTRDGLRLQPVEGTDLAMMVGPKGEPVSGQPAYRRAPMVPATTARGAVSNLLGAFQAPRYEPIPDVPQGRDQLLNGPEGTFVKRADGRTYSLETGPDGTRRWVEIPGMDEGDGNILLPAPGAIPRAADGVQSKLDAARKAAGY